MTIPQLFVIGVIAVPLVLILTNRLRLDVAAIIIAVSLAVAQFLGLGVLGPEQTPANASKALSGLSQPVIVTLFCLFVITRCLDRTGVTRWLARRILSVSGQSEWRLIGLLTFTTAFFSLFMNNLAAGALILPTAMELARRTHVKPSKLLIPIAYGSLLGGAATYFTTANILASDLLRAANPPQEPLNVLDFTPTGGLIALAGIAFLTFLGSRLLPDREPSPEQNFIRHTGSDLEDAYQLGERLWEIRVPPLSGMVEKTLAETEIGGRLGLSVAAIWHGRQAIFAPSPQQMIQEGDILLTIGREDRVNQLTAQGFEIGRDAATNGHISTRGVSFIEIILAPHSRAEGRSLKEIEFRRKYGFTAVALLRDGRSYRTDVADFKLRPGDSLLLVGPPNRLKALQRNPDFLALETDKGDQPVAWRQAAIAVTVTLGVILASILGSPVFLATLIGVVIIFLTGIITIEEAYRTMEWQALILIAGMYPLSIAMINTGLASSMGELVVKLVGPLGPLGLAAGAYIFTGLLTQAIGGQVSTLIAAPILISAAISLHTSPQAIAVASAIACSASFLTPIAHPVNILMIAPANYRFVDFFRIGWMLTVLSFIMLLVGMALFWHLGLA
ncbi:MAG: SLC13 family permease [Anaerolineaceae bacterium]|nr:SLC13 family permease [Anaerolineaceae bacterium]